MLKESNNSNFQWTLVLSFLIIIRLLILVFALIGANHFPTMKQITLNETYRSIPGVLARYDSNYYISIAQKGYSGDEKKLAFFPIYPTLIRMLSNGSSQSFYWSGFLISNISIILSSLLLWLQVKFEYDASIAWGSIITLNLFPTSFFFSAIYTESLFLLFSILVYWFAYREKYFLSAVFVSLAAVTRVNGLLLIIIPIVEIFVHKNEKAGIKILFTSIISLLGAIVYSSYLWITFGTPIAFYFAQEPFKRKIATPFQSIFDSIAVAVCGYGGFEKNWFMRVVSLHDFIFVSLFITSAVVGFRILRRSLFLYLLAALLLILISHGPYTLGLYAGSRFVLILFPSFVIFGYILQQFPRAKWIYWTGSFFLLFFLTAWFGTGRWVA